MKNIKVVIGANFGDEGKGLMTDYFCEQADGSVLNVRYNATSQAGHTVERDGLRHVFAHFGAGSMVKDTATYLSSFFFFNPISFFEELDELRGKGIRPTVFLCRESEAITIYDVFFNCIIEEARGNERHGSCGAGLWEAVNRTAAGYYLKAFRIDGIANKDVVDDEAREYNRTFLREVLTNIRDEYYPKRFAQMGVEFTPDSEWYDIWFSQMAMDNYIDLFMQMKNEVILVDEDEILNKWNNQVYEGAQGLLLDYGNREYMPNLTASYTGSKNVVQLLNKLDDEADVEICYVTRTYFTRHGAGKFVTETTRDNLDRQSPNELVEQTNITNRWQGSFRWGYFDGPLFKKSIDKDGKWLADCRYKSIKRTVAFTHANITDKQLLMPDKNVPVKEFAKELPFITNKYYMAMGKCACDVIAQ